MVGTKARWYAPTAPAKADPPVRGNPIYPGLIDGDKKKQGREKRRDRQPQRKPGGAPSYKPYDYPQRRPRPLPEIQPERTPRPVTRRPPAVRLPKLRLPLPFVNPITQQIVDWIDPFPARNPFPYKTPVGWCIRGICHEGPPPGFTGNMRASPLGTGWACDAVEDCIDGQAVPEFENGTQPFGDPFNVTVPGINLGIWWEYVPYEGVLRFKHHITYGWQFGPDQTTVPTQPRTWINLRPATDPNLDRYRPIAPDPWASPKPRELVPGVGPSELSNPESPFEPDHAWSWQPTFGLMPGVVAPPISDHPAPPPVRPVDPAPPARPLPPVQRQPPARGEKQRKVITKTKAIGLALYKALDAASESAEVVDALFEALPDDVKKRWQRADRVGDNFGQYGLGGADWKLRALYYNWHRLDVVQAIKNIIKNELQDRIIGGMQAGLPNNTGAAHSQGEKRLAKLLDEWFAEELGL